MPRFTPRKGRRVPLLVRLQLQRLLTSLGHRGLSQAASSCRVVATLVVRPWLEPVSGPSRFPCPSQPSSPCHQTWKMTWFALIFSATPIPSLPFLSTGTHCAAEEEPSGESRAPFSYIRPFGVFGLWFNKFSHFSSESQRFRRRGVETKNDRGNEIK